MERMVGRDRMLTQGMFVGTGDKSESPRTWMELLTSCLVISLKHLALLHHGTTKLSDARHEDAAPLVRPFP